MVMVEIVAHTWFFLDGLVIFSFGVACLLIVLSSGLILDAWMIELASVKCADLIL